MMLSSDPHFLLLLLLLLAGIQTPALAATNPTAAKSTDFIRASCSTTRYPDLCVSELSPYATDIGHSPTRLARAASAVSISRITAARARVKALESRAAPEGLEAAALKDCVGSLADAADQTRRSMAMLGALGKGLPLFASRLGTVKTWMSAAETNVETCTDDFLPATSTEDAVARSVAGDVKDAKMYASNALALVNKLDD